MNINIYDNKLNNFIYLDVNLTFCAYKYNNTTSIKTKHYKTKALKTAIDKHAFATVLFQQDISFN